MASKRWVAIGGTAAVIAGAGVFIARATLFSPQDKADRLLADMKTTPEEQRFEGMRRIREQVGDMSDEEQRKLRDGMRAMFEEQMDERVNEYENAPEDQKLAVLDKHIDEMVERRAEWEKRRAEREAERAQGGDSQPTGGSQPGSGDAARGGPEGRGPGGLRQPPTIEERKRRMEGSNPDSQVRRMRYFRAVRERAQERGIDMGRGPGGRGPGGRNSA